jgi:hypothetical protein
MQEFALFADVFTRPNKFEIKFDGTKKIQQIRNFFQPRLSMNAYSPNALNELKLSPVAASLTRIKN